MTRVFIFCQNALFGEGVANVLRQDARFQIVGSETNEVEGIHQIHALQPDVVIIDGDDPAGDLGPALASILRQSTQASVIGLNLEFNTMCMYHGERRAILRVQDLMEAIER